MGVLKKFSPIAPMYTNLILLHRAVKQMNLVNKTIKFDNYPMTNAFVVDGSVTTSYSGKNWTIDVPCGRFTKVLLDVFPNGNVSFFSLDVEGS